MEITVNGETTRCSDEATVAGLLAQLDVDGKAGGGIAVAVNHNVIPRRRWEATTLNAGDAVEIIHAVQGG
jgi:sulfur carrier protein